MRCEKAEPLLARLLDGELDRWTAGRVRRHLAGCASCRNAYREFEALGAAARSWRAVTASPALRTRIEAALAAAPRPEESEPAPITPLGHRAIRGKELFNMQTVRWGLIGVTAAGLALLWTGSQRGDIALAAVIRAAEQVRAVHFVAEGSHGTHGEAWWVDGVGSMSRVQRGRDEQLDVDNLKQRYLYSVHERPAGEKPGQSGAAGPSGVPALERRVDVMPSALADPGEGERTRETLIFADILKQLQHRHPPREIQSGWAIVNGRRLRRITAKGEPEVFYVDPETNRLVALEDWGGPGSQGEATRTQIDYPDPSAVDRRLFQFQVPAGVPVHRTAPGLPRRQRTLSRQEQVWLKEQNLLNGCLSRMSQIREALRRYANDHHGEWPPSLIPSLDAYVKDRDVFHCPADHGTDETSYIYHHLTGAQAALALKTMNESAPPVGAGPRMGSPVLLDCPHHPKWVWRIDAAGDTFGSRQPAAPR